MALTNNEIKNARSREKAYKLTDGDGLFLLITPNGSKYWRFKYRFNGKEKLFALGVYDQVTLADARLKRNKARDLLVNEIDPSQLKQEKKRLGKIVAENSFESIAREWHMKFSVKWTPKHSIRTLRQFEKEIFPWLGRRPITEITAPELLTALRRTESRGAIETAHRAHQTSSQVFRYAIATGRAERDPSADLRGALPPARKKHHASLTNIKAIGELLRAINDYQGYFITKCALRLAPLLFVRPGELRHAEWSEFNFETAEWRIPAEKMKM
jgi:Xaa-Pro aminopeptidase